uniref:Uncharacterized protein n=1 Tax=Setaria digitata TaxID=48799 RepID=A0A915Q3C7_9BILA
MAERLLQLESEHYDTNYIVRQKDFEINELTISVNDLRGKFVKPTLKKVSKTDTRFSKLKKKDQNFVDFRTNLKNVESNKFTLKEVETFTIYNAFEILDFRFSLYALTRILYIRDTKEKFLHFILRRSCSAMYGKSIWNCSIKSKLESEADFVVT